MSNLRQKTLIFTIILLSFFLVPNFGRADVLGQKESFFVDSGFDKHKRSQLSATLRYIGDRLYIYVEDSYWNGLGTSSQALFTDNMIALAGEFDDNIYLKEIQFWGSEPNPGVDGDSRITILLEQLISGNGGYFNTANGYTRDRVPDSNVREMIYINAEVINSGNNFAKVFLAHEFQHLISFNQKELINRVSEDTWLNELRSEYSVSEVGYNDTYFNSSLSRRVTAFQGNPSNSLTEWPNEITDYGIAAVFAEYLAEQYGRSILSETLKMPLISIGSINSFLQAKGYYERFSEVFLNWMTAVYLNDFSLNSHYGYIRPELKNIKVGAQQSVFLSGSSNDFVSSHMINDWQPIWLDYNLNSSSAKSIKIDISGKSDQNFLVSYITFFNDGRTEVNRLNVASGKGTGYVSNLGPGVRKIAVLATKGTKLAGFNTQESKDSLSVKVSLTDTEVVEALSLKDGDLIKKSAEKEIYVIWGKYKRYLVPGVIALYGHLDPASASEASPEIFFSHTTSNYVKYVNDPKVYAIWPDGTKHWLNITPQQWDASGRDWNSIFIINEMELNYYKTGPDITR